MTHKVLSVQFKKHKIPQYMYVRKYECNYEHFQYLITMIRKIDLNCSIFCLITVNIGKFVISYLDSNTYLKN